MNPLANPSLRSLRSPRMLAIAWLVACLVACFTPLADAAEPADLAGRWRSRSASVIELLVAADGALEGRLVEPSTDALKAGYLRGETVLRELKPAGVGFALKWIVHNQRPDIARLKPSHQALASATYDAVTATLILRRPYGRFVAVAEAGSVKDCEYVEDPQAEPVVDVLTRVVAEAAHITITDVTVRGVRDDAVAAAEVVDPVLPRFFVDEHGRPSLDLDVATARSARAMRVVAYAPGGGELAAGDVSDVMRSTANPVSGARWATIDLARVLAAGGFDLMQPIDGIAIVVEWTTSPGARVRLAAPAADRYRMLDWSRQRGRWLSELLLARPLAFARTLGADERRRLAWDRFLRSQDVSVAAELRNPSEQAAVRDAVAAFAMFDGDSAGRPARFEPLKSDRLSLGPLEEGVLLVDLQLKAWDDTKARSFRGVRFVVGDTNAPRPGGPDRDGRSYTVRMTVEPKDPRRLAARYMQGLRHAGESSAELADRFQNFRPVDPREADRVVASVRAARQWAAAIDELERVLARLDAAFATSQMARLHELVDGAAANVHFGSPAAGRESVRAADFSETWKVHDKVELEKSLSQRLFAGLMATATNGLAAGDIPYADDPLDIERRLLARNGEAVGLASHAWQAPRHYIDAFTQLSPEDARALVATIKARHPIDAVRGELAEGFSARQFGRQWVREARAAGRDPIYVNGWSIRQYEMTDGKLGGPGSKMADGLLLSVDGPLLRVHKIVEVKAGTSGVDTAADQLRNHESRIRRSGITLVEPTRSEIGYFRRLGIEPFTHVIAGRPRTVLHIPPARLVFDSGRLHELVTARDVPPAANSQRRVSLTRDRIHDLAADLMAYAGARPAAWNDPHLSLTGYRRYYQSLLERGLVPAGKRLTPDQLTEMFLSGRRFDPDPGVRDWRPIFSEGALRNTDPFMSIDDFIRAYKAQIGRPVSPAEEAEARERFRAGRRWNPTHRWQAPVTHLVDPHDPTLTPEEHTRHWRSGASSARIDEARSREMFERQGLVYDTGLSRWVKRHGEGFVTPSDRAETALAARRGETRQAKGSAAAEALAMAASGLRESERLARQRLLVLVRQKDQSRHLFLIVYRGEIDAGGTVRRWELAGSPAMQQLLLTQWFTSQGLLDDAPLPAWLAEAKPDGPEHSWWGHRAAESE